MGNIVDEGDKVGVSLDDNEHVDINFSDYEILFDDNVTNTEQMKSANANTVHGADINEGQAEYAESDENDSDQDVNKKCTNENIDENSDFDVDASLEDNEECSTEDSDDPSWL
ncbi:hypothetical protein U1Q18_009629 [Sarracenia purpurea var. burkii]